MRENPDNPVQTLLYASLAAPLCVFWFSLATKNCAVVCLRS